MSILAWFAKNIKKENPAGMPVNHMFFSELLPRVVVLAKDFDRVQGQHNQASNLARDALESASIGFKLYLDEIIAKDSLLIGVKAESLNRLLTMEFGYQVNQKLDHSLCGYGHTSCAGQQSQ